MKKFSIVASFSILINGVLLADSSIQSRSCQAPQTPETFQSFEDLTYKKNLGMDLYLPEHGENFPLAFIIHGGAWMKGNRKDFNPFAKQLTAMGYAAVTVSYRLADNASGRFPAPIEDLRCALKTLRSRSQEFSINPDKIIALGQSAGAHLAAELALTADSTEFNDSLCPESDYSTEVHNVVGYFGPYDLRKTDELNLGQIWIVANFLGGLPGLLPKVAELASPAAQIHDERVPFYLVHAANDDVVPVKSSRDFTTTLIEAGKDVQYIELNEGKHEVGYFDSRDFAQEATCGLIDRLKNFATEQEGGQYEQFLLVD